MCIPLTLPIIVGIHWLFLRRPPFESKYTNISSSESCVAQSIAEGVDSGVNVTQAVGDIPHHLRDNLNRTFIMK